MEKGQITKNIGCAIATVSLCTLVYANVHFPITAPDKENYADVAVYQNDFDRHKNAYFVSSAVSLAGVGVGIGLFAYGENKYRKDPSEAYKRITEKKVKQ